MTLRSVVQVFVPFVAPILGILTLDAQGPIVTISPPNIPQRFLGATRRGDLSSTSVPLSLDEALARGLQNNTGLLVAGTFSDQARAARLTQLSDLLPKIDGTSHASRQKINFRALGITLPAAPSTVEVTNLDARVFASVPLLDLHALSNARAAAESATAAEWDVKDARETVVLAVISTYLGVLTSEAAVATAEADLRSAQVLFDLATDRERVGLVPNIDTLRARVEVQTRQQALTTAHNALDKQRVALLRIVGLPLAQPVSLTTRTPYKSVPELTPDAALQRALATRADYKSAAAQVRAAEQTKRAAAQQRVPTVTASGDAGGLGTMLSDVVSTWSAIGLVRVPIFDGGRIRADMARADAQLTQRRAELEDLRVSIEQQVTDAALDIRAAAEEVDVAMSAMDVARQTLTQAQDRFAAGVTNNIEVVQAQEAVVSANNQYIAALYAHNVAKLTLAHAMGSAEQTWKDLLAP
jgi:outer membrane protein TolC